MNDGLAFASDSRTNAGVDRVSTFRKMFVFDRPGDRLFVLLTAGNLSVTQSVVSILSRPLGDDSAGHDLMVADSMFAAARIVGSVMREVQERDGAAIRAAGVDGDASIIFGGQVRGGKARLYQIYTPGNFVEATEETPYFQNGEVKYGKPVLDRVITPETPLMDAAKCALIFHRFDHALQPLGRPADRCAAVPDRLRWPSATAPTWKPTILISPCSARNGASP